MNKISFKWKTFKIFILFKGGTLKSNVRKQNIFSLLLVANYFYSSNKLINNTINNDNNQILTYINRN